MSARTWDPAHSSIWLWLDHLDEKRALATPREARKSPRKRVLQEMSGNITPMRQSGKAGKNVGRAQVHQGSDDDTTPHAEQYWRQSSLTGPTTVLRAGSQRTQLATFPASPSHSSSMSEGAQTSSAGSKRKRSESPVKLPELRYAAHQVEECKITTIKLLPPHLQPLASAARRCYDGKSIVPASEKALINQLAQDLDEPDSHSLAAASAPNGTPPPLETVRRIVRFADENTRIGRAEAAWNAFVHVPLLVEAWHHSNFRHLVAVEVLTSVSVEPPSLLPPQNASATLPSRKIDLGVRLAVDAATERARATIFDAVGQTYYSPLRFAPLAFSIETKAEDGGAQTAKLQLTTWGLAQAVKMRQLLKKVGNPTEVLPPLPLLLVQGHDWSLYLLEDFGTSARLWGKMPLGSTLSLLEAYKLLAFLQYLMRWAGLEYRQWWEANVFQFLPERPGTS